MAMVRCNKFLVYAFPLFPRCQWCNRRVYRARGFCLGELQPDTATKDHIVPATRGGSDDWSNLCIACHECNQSKGNADWGLPRFGPRWPSQVPALLAAAETDRKKSPLVLWVHVEWRGVWSKVHSGSAAECVHKRTKSLLKVGPTAILPEGVHPNEAKELCS